MNIHKVIFDVMGSAVFCLIFGYNQEVSFWIPPLRVFFRLVIGIFIAFLLWHIITWNLSINFVLNVEAEIVFRTFIVLIVLLYGFNRNARSIILLIFVAMLGHTGRNYHRAIAFSMLISGPIDNLVSNAAEIARVFACSTVLTYNLTKTRFDLMAKPFTNTLKNMKEDIGEVQENFKELQLIINDVKYGVENEDVEDDTFRYKKARRGGNSSGGVGNVTTSSKLPKASQVQAQFVRKMGNRCKYQLRSGHRVCTEVFREGYRKCATNFPNWLAKAICWPYRIDVICKVNMFGNPDKVCNAKKVVPSYFGETYVSFLHMDNKLFANSSNIKITYKQQNITTLEQLKSAQDTSKLLIADFSKKRRVFDTIMHTIENFLCFLIVMVIWSAIRYHWKYRSNVEFDNRYISHYFEHLDARRKRTAKQSILPLHSFEKCKYVEESNLWVRSHEEFEFRIFHLLQLFLEVIVVAIFILIDRLVVNLLRIIKKRSLITYHQEGEHEVRFRINGTGIMARLLRTTMNNFNMHEHFTTFLTNEECLPNASVIPALFYLKLFLLYMIIFILVYQSDILLRMRHFICGYFFYKREKQRILFLFNNILRDRRAFMDTLRDRVDRNLSVRHTQGRTNIFLILRINCPDHFEWLQSYRCAKRKCLVCNALEDQSFIICPSCKLPFCRECCRDIKRVCIFCDQILSNEEGEENTKADQNYQPGRETFKLN